MRSESGTRQTACTGIVYLFLVKLVSCAHAPVAEALARRRELAELVADHFFGDVHGQVVLAVVHEELEPGQQCMCGVPDKVGQDGAAPRVRADRRVILERILEIRKRHEEWPWLVGGGEGAAAAAAGCTRPSPVTRRATHPSMQSASARRAKAAWWKINKHQPGTAHTLPPIRMHAR